LRLLSFSFSFLVLNIFFRIMKFWICYYLIKYVFVCGQTKSYLVRNVVIIISAWNVEGFYFHGMGWTLLLMGSMRCSLISQVHHCFFNKPILGPQLGLTICRPNSDLMFAIYYLSIIIELYIYGYGLKSIDKAYAKLSRHKTDRAL
jgi:hypothetical protein